MKRIIRQVFGTTRPRDIWGDLLTFDRLVTKPIVHIVYWVGLGLMVIAAFGVLGVAVGSAVKDGTLMGILLSFPLLVVGWLSILVGVLLWRGCCEFFLAVMSIADDLRYLRQHQEKLDPVTPQASTFAAPMTAADVDVPAPVAEIAVAEDVSASTEPNILEDPFFRPRFEKREF